MRGATSAKWAAAAVAVALAATACGGGDDGGDGDKGASKPQVTMYSGEPQHGLIPSNTYESEGTQVIQALFTGLVSYDAKTSEPQLAMAESIETEDSKKWTIKLKDGYTFHNGEKVTAKSYVDAWNWGANQENAQETNPLFAKIDGYKDLNPGEKKKPTAKTMKGLKVVDEKTFEVTLTDRFSQFKIMLGFNPFMPLPEAFFKDPKAFEEAPIGNGPFKMSGKFEHNKQIKTVLNKKHPDAGDYKIAGVTFKIFADLEAGYRELQDGNVDIMDTIPVSALETADRDLGERFIKGDEASVAYIGFDNKTLKATDADTRKAISMAIDRKTIAEKIYAGSRTPADDFVNSGVPGYREGNCDSCKYEPAEAKKLYGASKGLPGDKLTLAYNADGDHKQWIEAVGNQLEENLGINVTVKPFEQFQGILNDLGDKKYEGAFRMGWIQDYPSIENWLRPLFSEEAITNGSNYSGYINPQFEKLMDEADQSENEDEAMKKYQAADDVLVKDMPYIPIYNYSRVGAVSEELAPLVFDPSGEVDWKTVKPAS
ncbi:ABC transporter substrate-binding protein [Streptomyces sp. A7024]|uniref:ABC transporter substrate-binding protein n=1 Tax=Streptomyces coryli TaxID=1128680 RepID=A0A6G4TUK8_9ACTN|nr:ABC transporter substrate-binding protein [Streptomyces coryli]NGN63452.1 ABC transporter substrate-binding protein [Streptomyces coryli]